MLVSAEDRDEQQKLHGLVYGVQLDSLEKSVSPNTENRADFIPTFLDTWFALHASLNAWLTCEVRSLAYSRFWGSFKLFLENDTSFYPPEKRTSVVFPSWGPFDWLSYIILASHSWVRRLLVYLGVDGRLFLSLNRLIMIWYIVKT